MITEIGIVAGEIWHVLDERQETVMLKDLLASIDAPRDLILMSVGWLAREGHVSLVQLSQDENSYEISLAYDEVSS